MNEYKSIYSDLAPLSNYDAALHYARNGFSEGRVGYVKGGRGRGRRRWRGREGEKERRGDANVSFLDVQFLAHSPTTGFGTFNTMAISSMLLVTADSVCTSSLPPLPPALVDHLLILL